MKKFGDFIVETVFPIFAVILMITVLFLIGTLVYISSNEAKMKEQAKLIFHFNNSDYYIESYEYSEDQIIAVDVNGKKIIFPKNCTIIEDIKGE